MHWDFVWGEGQLSDNIHHRPRAQHNHLALSSYNHICQPVPSKVLHPVDGASKPTDSRGHLGSWYTLT